MALTLKAVQFLLHPVVVIFALLVVTVAVELNIAGNSRK
jgi:hypothetical protein